MLQYVATVSRFSRNGKLIISYTLVKGITLALQGLIYNLFLLSLHFSTAMIGILDAMPPIMVLTVSLPLGILADRVGRKTLLVACGFLSPLTFLGTALFTSAGWQIVFGLANGVVSSFYWIAYPAIIVESSTDEDRQHLFSVNSMFMLGMGSVGYLLGGAITVFAGRLMNQSPDATGPLQWGMIMIAVLGAAGAFPLIWLTEQPRHEHSHRERPVYDIGLFARLLVPDALLAFGAGAILTFNQVYFAKSFGMTAGGLGVFLAIAGLLGSGGALVSPVLTRRFGTAKASIALLGVSVPLMAALALAPTLAFAAVIYVLWSWVRSAIDPTYTGFTMQQVPGNQRSTLSGLYSVTWAIGFGAGPVATGWLRGATGGFAAPFLAAAACCAVASVSLYILFGRGRELTLAAVTVVEKSVAR